MDIDRRSLLATAAIIATGRPRERRRRRTPSRFGLPRRLEARDLEALRPLTPMVLLATFPRRG